IEPASRHRTAGFLLTPATPGPTEKCCMKKLIAAAALAASAFTSAHVLAHHSFAAEFDANVPIKLHGVVTKVDWTNPHTYFYVEVENGNDVEEWALEMGSPNGLMRRGWTRDTLEIGTEVYVTGTRARDG